MNLRIERIDKDLVSSFSDFILPAVLTNPDYDKFSFYGAISENTLCGLLVCDIKEFAPEILSIGVSPKYVNQGVAKALLSYALKDLFYYFDRDSVDEVPNFVAARVLEKASLPGPMDHILTGFGFEPVSKGEFCEITVRDLNNNKYLQNAKIPKSITYLSLKDTPHSMIRAFNDELIKTDQFPGIEIDVLEEDLTVFGIKDDKIIRCILFLKEKQGVIQNIFLYQMPSEGIESAELMHLLSTSAAAAIRKFPNDTRLNFWIDNDTTRKLLDHMFPEAICEQKATFYELPFTTLKALTESRINEDLEFTMLANENILCADCKYCMADEVMECKKFYQKPDAVFEGGECKLYEKK